MSFWSGTQRSFEQRPTFGPAQESNFQNLQNSAMGSYGDVANYYRGILSNQSPDVESFAAPEMRRFREQTIPDLSEQFAGMGSGALSSSGFRNAAVSAGTDLSERIAAIRANLRQNAAQGLQGLGQQALAPAYENVSYAPQPGFSSFLGPILGAAGSSFGGPLLGAAGQAVGDRFSSWLNPPKGATSPYGDKSKNKVT